MEGIPETASAPVALEAPAVFHNQSRAIGPVIDEETVLRLHPEPGEGPVIFYCGFVDGSGDLKAFNNDVAVLRQSAEAR